MIKDINDYLPKLQEKYPKISLTELKKILEYGFNNYFYLTNKGADIQIGSRVYTAFCGKMFLDDYKRVLYNNAKRRIKLRLQYRYADEIYDGKYYFGLSEAEYDFFKSQIKSKRRSKIAFYNLKLHKIKEECYLDKSKVYFFELHYPVDVGWCFILDEIKTRNFKYFAKRNDKGQIIII